jgi:DNA-binding transcriptional ArsR family regulator
MHASTPARPKSSQRQSPRRRARGRAAPDELARVFASVARYFGLLSDPTRLRILHAICNVEQSVSAIVAVTGATQTNVSRHLGLLHRAGIVRRHREGSSVYYGAADPELVSICRSVCTRMAAQIDEGIPLKQELLAFAQHG